MPRAKAAIFDCNGTLLTDLDVSYESIVNIFRRYRAKPPTLKEYQDNITSNFSKLYYDYGLPRSVTPEQINALRGEYYRLNNHRVKFHADTEITLRGLKSRGVKLAIVSGEVEAILLEKLDEARLRDYFGCNIQANVFKDKKDALLDMVKKLGVD